MTAEDLLVTADTWLAKKAKSWSVLTLNMTSNSKNKYPKKVNPHAFLHHPHSENQKQKKSYKKYQKKKNRRGWDSNPRGETPMD